MDYGIWSQILLELALAVSGEQQLNRLLQKAVPVFLRKLDCTSVVVYQRQDEGWDPVHTAPKWAAKDPAHQEVMGGFDVETIHTDARKVLHVEKGGHYYGFPLKDFGLLLLTRDMALEHSLVMELLPVVDMLAHNCRGCLEITRREEVEITLRSERAFLKALMDTIPDLVFYKDREGVYQVVNEAAGTILGLPADQVVGMKDEDLHHAREAREYRRRDEKLLASGKPFTYETQYQRPGGGEVHYETSLSPFCGESGRVQGILGIARNIEERKNTQAALDQKMAFQRMLMNLATYFINVPMERMDQAVEQVLETAGSFMEVDRAYVFAYDFQAGLMHNTHEWCGRGISPAIQDLQEIPCELFMDDWVRKHQQGEALFIPKVEQLPHESNLYQILSDQGIKTLITIPLIYGEECLGFIGFDAVQTEKQWQEDEIALLKVVAELFTNAEMKKRHEKEMITARERAEAASQAKSEFLANMSHEIRTPLNGIVSAMYLMQDTPLDDEQQQSLDMINDSVDSLLAIINNILDYSKMEAGHLELLEEPFDLQEEVLRVSGMFKGKALEKNVDIQSVYDENTPRHFQGDGLKIRQVLLNLVGNAVKFTERGHVRISVAQADEGEKGEKKVIQVKVEDTGKGIPPSFQPRIFQQFTQEDASSTKKHGGTGLGLAISKQLVEFMGGTIGFESQVGKGATFYVHLPLALAPELDPALAPEKTIEQAASSRPRDTGHKPAELSASPSSRDQTTAGTSTSPSPASPVKGVRLLLVDDHRSNRLAAKMILAKKGYQVVEAESGFQALEILGTRAFDLILMDIQMPDMNGYETTRRIREMGDAGRQIPIIALTANAMEQDRQRSLAAGMDDHIAKPFKLKELNRIAEVLNKRETEQAMEKHHAGETAQIIPDQRQERGSVSGNDHDAMMTGPATVQPLEEKAVFDRDSFLARYDGDLSVALEVMQAFQEDLAGHLSRIEVHLIEEKAAAIKDEAHSLKGASGYVSASEIRECAQLLMKSGAERDMAACRQVFQRLETASTRFGSVTREWQKKLTEANREMSQ